VPSVRYKDPFANKEGFTNPIFEKQLAGGEGDGGADREFDAVDSHVRGLYNEPAAFNPPPPTYSFPPSRSSSSTQGIGRTLSYLAATNPQQALGHPLYDNGDGDEDGPHPAVIATEQLLYENDKDDAPKPHRPSLTQQPMYVNETAATSPRLSVTQQSMYVDADDDLPPTPAPRLSVTQQTLYVNEDAPPPPTRSSRPSSSSHFNPNSALPPVPGQLQYNHLLTEPSLPRYEDMSGTLPPPPNDPQRRYDKLDDDIRGSGFSRPDVGMQPGYDELDEKKPPPPLHARSGAPVLILQPEMYGNQEAIRRHTLHEEFEEDDAMIAARSGYLEMAPDESEDHALYGESNDYENGPGYLDVDPSEL
jgi:hypothetical protein